MEDFSTKERAKSRIGVLWRHRDFMKLWVGQTVSEIGSRFTRDGVPMAAVIVLGAKPEQMGYLTAVGAASVLLFGLVAGMWVDRLRRRPVMIAADLARAAVLFSIPIAALMNRLSMAQLYIVIALTGFCTVFFDVAYQSYLPSLVERENLLEGNSKLGMSSAAAEIVGPGLNGVLVQLITAPMAILLDAISFVFSAVSVGMIRKREATDRATHELQQPVQEMLAGLRFVFHHRLLRPIASFSLTTFFSMGFIGPIYTLFSIRELHLSPAELGVVIAMGGVGAMIGAHIAPIAGRKFGLGPTLIGSALAIALAYVMIPLAHGSVAMAMSFLFVQQLFGDTGFMTLYITELTLRQSATPEHVLGRVNAAMQLATRGIFPFGALTGGFLAAALGMRATLVLSVVGVALGTLWLIVSPVRKLREVPVCTV